MSPVARPCIGCGALIARGSRCRACRPARQLNGWAWNARRREALARDGHACTRCGSRVGLEVHHLHPLRLGGTDDLDNLATLCGLCHRRAA